MQILYIILGVIGLTMTFLGAKWSIKSFRAKEIINFPITHFKKDFEIIKPGLYALCIVGGASVNDAGNLRILIKHKDDQHVVELKEHLIKPRFRKKGKIGVEYLQFKILHSGRYQIELKNIDNLIVKKSRLTAQQIFQSPLSFENIEISIKETITIGKKIFGIIFLVLGINASFWGIALSIYPNLFG